MNETPKTLSGLQLTTGNPRLLTREQSETMDRQLDEFGPLDGIVYNVNPAIRELVGGNQRTLKFRAAADPEVVIERRYETPTDKGTVAEGYVRVDGERWSYREVHWNRSRHKAAVIAANNAGGSNDLDALAEFAIDIEDDWRGLTGLDLDNLQPDPFDEPEGEQPPAKPTRTARYTTDDLRVLVRAFYPNQAETINGFLAWVDEREVTG